MNKRDFIKQSSLGALGISLAPSLLLKKTTMHNRLRTAHIGVGGMGFEDLKAISSHPLVDVVALCDVDADLLDRAKEAHPKAKTFSDYRVMLQLMGDDIDAVIVSTPDHTHAPASLAAMQMNKHVYCQKPL
ncbi:MAG: Gfo/Idh/MocA family oxidoreductase, partial [Flavobacteriaceae bacterium]|nr:Gfo/Idh/MocA family oxidoreductase [Flavobacteriaceae bacterium]